MSYGAKEYWDERYKKQEGTTFDWLESYESLKELVFKALSLDKPLLEKAKDDENEPTEEEQAEALRYKCSTIKVLNIGCGNSPLAEEMHDEDSF